jgi:hypothetical protein
MKNEAIPISGEVDFAKLLERLSDDIVTAPELLRIDDQLSDYFEKYSDEVGQATFFWDRVTIAVRETGRSRLARIYDQEKTALSLRTLLATIEAHKHLFEHEAVKKRVNPVNPSFAQMIVPGSHFPDPKTLKDDKAEVSCDDPLVKKLVLWRNNFGAHISGKQTIKKTLLDGALPTQEEAFELCDRAVVIFNRYSSLFRADFLSKTLGEKGSTESVFRLLRAGLAAGRKEANEAAERLLKSSRSGNQG